MIHIWSIGSAVKDYRVIKMHSGACCTSPQNNKLKSLKVAQVKDEMDDDEDDGCEGVCDVAWLCCV